MPEEPYPQCLNLVLYHHLSLALLHSHPLWSGRCSEKEKGNILFNRRNRLVFSKELRATHAGCEKLLLLRTEFIALGFSSSLIPARR